MKRRIIKAFISISLVIFLALSFNFESSFATGNTRVGKITASVLNVRQSATTSSSIVTQVRRNQTYQILSSSNNWHQITANGRTGWIHGDYVQISQQNAGGSSNAQSIQVTTSVLNVRQSASTSSARVTQVRLNQVFTVLGQSGRWYQISANGRTGWVHGDYVKATNQTSTPPPTPTPPPSAQSIQVTTSVLNVRQSASTSSARVTQVRLNQVFTVLGQSGRWYQISANGRTGWVHGDYVKVTNQTPTPEPKPDPKPNAQSIQVTTSVLNVRQRATTSSSILTQVRLNQVYNVLEQSGAWYKITANGKTGWVHGDYVKVVQTSTPKPEPKPDPEPKPIPKPELKSLDIKGRGYEGDTQTITAQATGQNGVLYQFLIKDLSNNKTTIIRDYSESNTVNWTPEKAGSYSYEVRIKDKLSKEDQGVSQVKNITINPIPAAKINSLIIDGTGYATDLHTLIAEGTSLNGVLYQFSIKDLDTNESKIIKAYDEKNTANWIPEKAGKYLYEVSIKDKKSKQSQDASLSKEVSISNHILYGVSKYDKTVGEMVDAQMKSNPQTDLYGGGWKTAKKEDVEKYIDPENQLQFTPDTGENTSKTARITANPTLNVRSLPGTHGSVLTRVNNGETYTILAQSNHWYKINVKGVEGWISGAYVDVKTNYTKMKAVQITTSALNVRASNTTASNVLTQVRLNEVYVVLDQSNNWYKIKANGVTGWISGDYAKLSNSVPTQMYQFLVLSGTSGITVNDLNAELVGKGILEGKAQSFIEAGRKYNVNEVYLLSHALLETGHGKSSLATGIMVNTVDGQAVEPRMVYNMFGIGAYDRDPLRLGSEYAYKQGWFTPEAAIVGGAQFIANGYINNPNYKQDTLYKMRWNPETPGVHQYATDIGWATKQTSRMQIISDMGNRYSSVILRFDIPIYTKIELY